MQWEMQGTTPGRTGRVSPFSQMVDGPGLYQYVKDNPATLLDPSGFQGQNPNTVCCKYVEFSVVGVIDTHVNIETRKQKTVGCSPSQSPYQCCKCALPKAWIAGASRGNCCFCGVSVIHENGLFFTSSLHRYLQVKCGNGTEWYAHILPQKDNLIDTANVSVGDGPLYSPNGFTTDSSCFIDCDAAGDYRKSMGGSIPYLVGDSYGWPQSMMNTMCEKGYK
jgi:hypothetical protein